jgi:hypothetical protein
MRLCLFLQRGTGLVYPVEVAAVVAITLYPLQLLIEFKVCACGATEPVFRERHQLRPFFLSEASPIEDRFRRINSLFEIISNALYGPDLAD